MRRGMQLSPREQHVAQVGDSGGVRVGAEGELRLSSGEHKWQLVTDAVDKGVVMPVER
jgi:hypothetical protein